MLNRDTKTTASILPVRWTQILCVLAGFYAIIVAAYLVIETGNPLGSRDFHPFWYAGHFIHQGSDPYAAYLAAEPPQLPIHYLDGVTIDHYPFAYAELSFAPTNTPILLLFASLFSYFSWGAAKWLFFFFNMILMALTGWVVLRQLPYVGVRLARLDEVLIFLLYFDLSATRIAIENGQTTLLVFLMMLLALIYLGRSWLLAGSALGMALSKYSLSLPVFLFFLYKRDFRGLLLALGIQGLGLLGLAAITSSSPELIIRENILIFAEIFEQPGIHLSHFFERLVDSRLLAQIPALIMTLLVFIPLLLWLRRYRAVTSSATAVLDLHLIVVLFTWTLLVAYHRLYDTLILIVFVILVFKGLADPAVWRLDDKSRRALLAVMAVLPFILVLPARIVGMLWPPYYGTVSDAVTTIFLLILLTVSMLLLRRFLYVLRTQTQPKELNPHDL